MGRTARWILAAGVAVVGIALVRLTVARAQRRGFVFVPPISQSTERESTREQPSATDHTAPNPAVVQRIARIEQERRSSRYSHATHVDEEHGRFDFDCSGMAAWVLARSAPEAHRAVVARAGGRPRARDYYRQFIATPDGRTAHGWMRITRVRDARAGDVLAGLQPPDMPSDNTGHVVFLLSSPEPTLGNPHAYTVRIADSTSTPHGSDTRGLFGHTGFGEGTITLVADSVTDEPVAFGWFGQWLPVAVRAPMAIGRPVR
jgi:hypothetical protein